MSFTEQFLEIVKEKVVGASAYIVKGGKIVEHVNVKKMSLEENQDINDETIFRIASISKIVVAMAAMKLIEENKADLDDDIGDILGFRIRNPHHPNEKITIRMLMLQTSSILMAMMMKILYMIMYLKVIMESMEHLYRLPYMNY